METVVNPYKAGPVKAWVMSEVELAAYRVQHPPKPYKKNSNVKTGVGSAQINPSSLSGKNSHQFNVSN